MVMLMEQPTPDDTDSELLTRINPKDYSLGLIIAHHNTPQTCFDTMSLRLRYWVILVNNKLAYPSARTKPERRQVQPQVVAYSAGSSSFIVEQCVIKLLNFSRLITSSITISMTLGLNIQQSIQ